MAREIHTPIEFSRFSLTHTTLVSDLDSSASGVVFAFTERSGGVSPAPYDSLNLALHVEDSSEHALKNREILLDDLGLSGYIAKKRLLVPSQIHSDKIVEICEVPREQDYQALLDGADGIICTIPGYATLLMYADCVPVVIVGEGAFAVVHSGWKGTLAHISKKALLRLCEITQRSPQDFTCYIGPHIDQDSYEVSQELISTFTDEFDAGVSSGRLLSLSYAIQKDLKEAGVPEEQIADCKLSTTKLTDRFFSHRKSGGSCGRHAAIAFFGKDLRNLDNFKLRKA